MKTCVLMVGTIMLCLCVWRLVGAQDPQSSAPSSVQSSAPSSAQSSAQNNSDLTSLLIAVGQHAPQSSSASAPSGLLASSPSLVQEYNQFRITQERGKLMVIVSVIVAALLAMGMLLFVLMRRPQSTPTDIVHGCGLILVVFATVLVVIMADTEQQLTAAIGILGAIVGYLFGSTVNKAVSGTGHSPEAQAPSPAPTAVPGTAQPA